MQTHAIKNRMAVTNRSRCVIMSCNHSHTHNHPHTHTHTNSPWLLKGQMVQWRMTGKKGGWRRMGSLVGGAYENNLLFRPNHQASSFLRTENIFCIITCLRFFLPSHLSGSFCTWCKAQLMKAGLKRLETLKEDYWVHHLRFLLDRCLRGINKDLSNNANPAYSKLSSLKFGRQFYFI